MKYECTMCGNLTEGSSPPTGCEVCGNDEFREKAFDVRCPLCGQGYYEDEKPKFCGSCGYRLGATPPAVSTKGVTFPAPAKRMPRTSSSAPSPRSGDGSGFLSWRRIFGVESKK